MLDLEVLFELFVLFEDELLLLLDDLTLEEPEFLLEVLLPEELEPLLEEDDPAAAYPSAMTN
ncbi:MULTISPECIES: hypothetical protein [Brevibacillus]|uniref:hypothetical protein n=1 Tax=Brevibacillus TaxID=55080 RepID=UPI002580D066|nr:hypothetical protein [Brevibacillus sp.]